MPAHPDLVAQNAQFAKKIHKLSDNVYSAVGYAASNVHFLIGDAGIVLIDTTETTQAAENILADFRAISNFRSPQSSILTRIGITFPVQQCLPKVVMLK